MALTIKPLVLAGGRSVRMGSPKHLLELPDGKPLYQHQIDVLRQACPEAQTVYISLAKDSPLDGFLREAATDISSEPPVVIIRDLQDNDTPESGGPSQGLLSAFNFDPTATWFVVAVDYPLLRVGLLRKLRDAYQPPVACFRNADGFCEPLVAIWSPEALGRLAEAAAKGKIPGPSSIVRQLSGKQIDHVEEEAIQLRNVNTREDWEAVQSLLGGL
ncbi:nucleotide-diphospho-sugar transferase [Triangularia verruculosa]|uniref:Nucleotide-diphospho-sugar transferase n=1 Tax=Triangularia verruculosa TaxID=2587418 RepID=A0AAN7AXW6_9PEZI|nr:nucleotide-diphospho-sugar transferase [Triangularia verruculosa]